jgi:PII-like signaling protein
MTEIDVTMVRVYLTEGEHRMAELIRCLHDDEKVRGLTVFRGITGFGKSGQVHSSTLLDVSLDLPLVIEFFDTPDKTAAILEHLQTRLEPGHIVSWPARLSV